MQTIPSKTNSHLDKESAPLKMSDSRKTAQFLRYSPQVNPQIACGYKERHFDQSSSDL